MDKYLDINGVQYLASKIKEKKYTEPVSFASVSDIEAPAILTRGISDSDFTLDPGVDEMGKNIYRKIYGITGSPVLYLGKLEDSYMFIILENNISVLIDTNKTIVDLSAGVSELIAYVDQPIDELLPASLRLCKELISTSQQEMKIRHASSLADTSDEGIWIVEGGDN